MSYIKEIQQKISINHTASDNALSQKRAGNSSISISGSASEKYLIIQPKNSVKSELASAPPLRK